MQLPAIFQAVEDIRKFRPEGSHRLTQPLGVGIYQSIWRGHKKQGLAEIIWDFNKRTVTVTGDNAAELEQAIAKTGQPNSKQVALDNLRNALDIGGWSFDQLGKTGEDHLFKILLWQAGLLEDDLDTIRPPADWPLKFPKRKR